MQAGSLLPDILLILVMFFLPRNALAASCTFVTEEARTQKSIECNSSVILLIPPFLQPSPALLPCLSPLLSHTECSISSPSPPPPSSQHTYLPTPVSRYIQQLREGVNNFFATFIEVLKDRKEGRDWELEPGITCGDFLFGMLQVKGFKKGTLMLTSSGA